ncbi:Fe(3+)-hydroxamate ABC transporter permease FhuB [Mesorhizobium sp. CAU 1741]|uniref:Fe(3+)-hydroxamate ABC transporter permease FhuB n=1 Tax=Mesorhizobium sp. CAU 1741 TaxID=3140366 RepID=UPI00325B7E3B
MAIALWAALGLLATLLFAVRLHAGWPGADDPLGLQRVILLYSTLPRAAVAILAGAALGLSGLLLQRVLRNALAEPSTLGISAGAQLAMALATLHAPFLMAWSPGAVAFAGGIAAVSLVLALNWRRGLEPVSVVLAGMMVALTATSLSGALILANGDYLFSIFIWGGGSLVQQSWEPTIAIGGMLAVGYAVALLMIRPLSVLGLDDSTAKGLGVAVNAGRLGAIALAVGIATTVASRVGVIGFVGLAAPALAGLCGARTLGQRLVAAPVIGAILLWLADGMVQLLSGTGGERVPTGAATALLGGPLLLWILPRLRMMEWPSLSQPVAAVRRSRKPWRIVMLAAGAAVGVGLVAVIVGSGPEGIEIAHGALLADLAPWRYPRILVAAACGIMLATAGVILQRLTGNPLASPEVLGVGAGAGVGLVAVLAADVSAGLGPQFAGAAIGALATLSLVLLVAASGRFGPERMLLGGIAVGAACSAVITAVISLGNMQSYALLRWLTGSTSEAQPLHAAASMAAAMLFLGLAAPAVRWLNILPLGGATASSLGVPLARARLAMMVLAALMTATASLFVGPLSFVGLIAPHLARLIGLNRAVHHLFGSAVLGTLLLVCADWLARTVAFPYQLPVGLFASLLGGPYLVYLLSRGTPSRA